jgi:hypothetical protein
MYNKGSLCTIIVYDKSVLALCGAVLLIAAFTQGATAAGPSSLSEQNTKELEQLLAVPEGKQPVNCSDRQPSAAQAALRTR